MSSHNDRLIHASTQRTHTHYSSNLTVIMVRGGGGGGAGGLELWYWVGGNKMVAECSIVGLLRDLKLTTFTLTVPERSLV